ncbi:MAG: hypothetical protein JSR60_20615, partial [Proteobacteria bacterium]|nr:hypothetical protein [Pseudomonadota bacterium]
LDLTQKCHDLLSTKSLLRHDKTPFPRQFLTIRLVQKGPVRSSRDIARERGCALLVAFMTAINHSARALLSAGFRSMPTGYFTAAPDGSATSAEVPDNATPEQAWALRGSRTEAIRFGYSEGEWRTQFIDRPSPVEILRLRGGAIAIVEEKNEFDRLLDLIVPPGTSHANAISQMRSISTGRGRTLFTFAADPETSAMLEAAGFERKSGLATALPLETPAAGRAMAAAGEWPFGAWRIANGDRM